MIINNIDDNKESQDWSNVLDFSKENIEVSSFEINDISYFRQAFGQHAKDILSEQHKIADSNGNTGNKYYDGFNKTSNGETLVNPTFDVQDGKLSINAEIGFYESYHAFNGLKNGFGDNKINFDNNIEYKVLSAGVIMYDESNDSFYLFKRPEDSQEAPGAVDLLGGCMNTRDGVDDGVVNPGKFVQGRIKAKSGLNIECGDLQILGVQEFKERGFFNLVYLYNLNKDEVDKLNKDGKLSKISNETIEQDKNQDNPGGSALTLALEYLENKKD